MLGADNWWKVVGNSWKSCKCGELQQKYPKYVLKSEEIHIVIWTNTYCNMDKYIWYSGQILLRGMNGNSRTGAGRSRIADRRSDSRQYWPPNEVTLQRHLNPFRKYLSQFSKVLANNNSRQHYIDTSI